MAAYTYLICKDCLSQVFVGWFDRSENKAWVYVGDEETRQRIGRFLPRHVGHHLLYLHDEHSDYEDIEDVLADDEAEPHQYCGEGKNCDRCGLIPANRIHQK